VHRQDHQDQQEEQVNIARVQLGGETRWAIVEDDQVYRLIGSPFDAPRRGERIGSLGDVRLLAPVVPSKIVAIGLNYLLHARESGQSPPPEPQAFFKPPSAVIGHLDTIYWPPETEQVDYEAELVAVIGRRARHVPLERAREYVLGYTCGNDVSARDFQRNDLQWFRAKGADTFCPLGPWITTDLDPRNLRITGTLNGAVRQDSSTSDLIHGVDKLVAHITRWVTLEPGDVIMTGTPAGIGPMQPGDEFAVSIEGIGTLRNRFERTEEGE
jgi:2-keto-4-pentenoate hydratase/2-oxohepta-3-ene-1,7-dioic acid hydratase in catechol pathway